MSGNVRTQLASQLLPAHWALVKGVSAFATRPVYFVGGLVRDLLLSHTSPDLDMVIIGDGIVFARQMQRRFGGEIRQHKQFGTAKWFVTPDVWQKIAPDADLAGVADSVDFVTGRSEVYPRPGSLPITTPSTLTDDLARRDFTINTLAIRLDGAHLGELIDQHNGQADLANSVVRVVHDASFVDDPTRIFRAVRYAQRLGFEIEPHTLALLQAGLGGLDLLTPARVRHEFERIWDETRPGQTLTHLHQLNILQAVHSALTLPPDLDAIFQRLRHLVKADLWADGWSEDTLDALYWAIWLSHLTLDEQAQVVARLRLRRSTAEMVQGVTQLAGRLASLPAGSKPSVVEKTIRPFATRPGTLLANRALTERNDWLDAYWQTWRHQTPTLTGHDLRQRGLKPGPQFAHILDELRSAYLDGNINDPAGEEELLNQILQKAQAA